MCLERVLSSVVGVEFWVLWTLCLRCLFVLFSGDFAVPHGFCSLGHVQEEQVWAGPKGWGGSYLMEEEGLDEGAAWIAVGQGHRVV